MTDYRVVYVNAPRNSDRQAIGRAIEDECDRSAREGWFLDETIPDLEQGTTCGVWLVFASGDDAVADLPEVVLAERIIAEEQSQ